MIEVTYVDHMGNDSRVVDAARVSFSKTADNYSEKDNHGLIRYLAKHEHYSPFNHTFITLHIQAPIFVARQLQKHEYMPWNETSRRYVKTPPQFYRPEYWREKAENVKQGSSDKEVRAVFDWDNGMWVPTQDRVDMLYEEIFDLYNHMIAESICPEQARMILPQAMMTEWYWSGTLKAWAKMYNLRADSHAQKETQEVALQAGKIIEGLFPVSWNALTQTTEAR